MRPFHNFLALALIALCVPSVFAQDAASAKAKAAAAIALSQAQRDRAKLVKADECDAKCKASLLLATLQRERSDREGCMTDLPAAIARAESEKKPLFVWVGMTCDRSIRNEFKDAVHCHTDSLNGSNAPRLIVGAEEPNLRLMKSELEKAAPVIRQFLQPAKTKTSAPVMQPIMFQPVMSQSC